MSDFHSKERIKACSYGLSFADLEESLAELGLDWTEEKKVTFWEDLCINHDCNEMFGELHEAISWEVER